MMRLLLFIICLLFSWSAFAQLGPKQSGPPNFVTVYPGNSIQVALTSVSLTGGSVYIKAGSYPQTTSLIIYSDTRVVCEPGATITATDVGWPAGPVPLLTNANWGASVITDHDIDIEGCTFSALGSLATNGAFHHIGFRKAQHIRITNKNSFIDGGDGTAMQATADTVISDNYMTGAVNACWDHWEAPTSVTVRNNFCGAATLYGILVSGTNTAGTLAGTGGPGDISGNVIQIVSGGGNGAAGIWLNGLGTSGAGTSNIVVRGNHISGDGTVNFTCLKGSGDSTDDLFSHNICSNSGTNSLGASLGTDAGGTISNSAVDDNIFDGIQVQTGNIAVVQLLGTKDTAISNKIYGGNYPSLFWLGGANDIAVQNVGDLGTSVTFNLSGATNPITASASGGLSLLSTQTASNASDTLEFTNIPSGYNTVLLDCNGIVPASNNVAFQLQYGEGSTPNWETSSTYRYSGSSYNTTAGATNPFNAAAAGIVLNTLGLSSSYSFSAKIWVSLVSSYKIATYQVGYQNANDGADMSWISGSGAYTGDTGVITALRVITSSGNINSGQCSLYGLSPQ